MKCMHTSTVLTEGHEGTKSTLHMYRAIVTCTWGDRGAAASDQEGKVSLGKRAIAMVTTATPSSTHRCGPALLFYCPGW